MFGSFNSYFHESDLVMAHDLTDDEIDDTDEDFDDIEEADSEDEDKPKKRSKKFNQPGVNFSIDGLRQLELKRSLETGDPFRLHVEAALVYFYMHPQNDWDKANKPDDATLSKWLEDILANRSHASHAVAELAAAREELAALKAKLAQLEATRK